MLEPRQHVLRGREMLNKNAYSEVMVKEQKCWTIVFSPNSVFSEQFVCMGPGL